GRVRKIHILIFAPSFEVVEKINAQLGWIGNLKSDGRPILGLDAKELAKIVLSASEDCLVVPAHAWTPWFSIFGSKSGFDSIEECFEEYSKYIYALETGLSSDPLMNWRLSALDKITLISNSDAHSGPKLGREANVFDTELSYKSIIEAIKTKNRREFLYTIEFFPEEGKYHFDGHRICGIKLSPQETKKYNGICPVCGKTLTIGVLNRVEELADREEGFKPEGAIPFKSLVPLKEIIADVLDCSVGTKEVEKEYKNLIETLGSEFNVLLEAPKEKLETITLSEISEAIIKVREGRVFKEPGYDGVYGKIRIFSQGEQKNLSKQDTLF
ncbi:MAG: endonuclease Q family protein, partial [bacterium]|nr:endonuclease Q family protein [bacterium]